MINTRHRGRINLITDEFEIDKDNIIDILQKAIKDHEINAMDCTTLIDFEAGKQPLDRVKTFRSDVDWEIVDNVANTITDFKLGFHWGYPITLVQRGNDKKENALEAEAIQMLNECYAMSGNDKASQELARFIEITGIGYTFIDINTEWEEGHSYFTRDVLDPRNAFVIKSNYYTDKRPILGVTFRTDKNKNSFYTCFTKDTRFELANRGGTWTHEERSGEKNPLGRIPIIEWIRSYDRQGCFERLLSELVGLNLLVSDAANAVDQNVLAVWHTNDVEFPKEIVKNEDGTTTERIATPESGDWINTYTTPDGKQPFIKPLTMDYGLSGIMDTYSSRRAYILQKAHVPQRNDNSGGSTGIAMDDASGWSDAEVVASAQERITDGCKMQEVDVVLAAIRESSDVKSDNPMLKLRTWDVQPNTRRPKNHELTVKVNSVATLLSHGFALEDVVSTIPLFADPAQVVLRSSDGVKAYQEKNAKTSDGADETTDTIRPDADKIMQDPSDQIGNSPELQNV